MNWFREGKKPNGYWVKERVFNEAKKYRTRTEFQKGSNGAYTAALKLNVMDQLFPKKKVV